MTLDARISHSAILVLVAAAVLAAAWTGFTSSDDIGYYEAGKGWLTRSWFVPTNVWEMRTTAALPIAAAIAFVGDSEFAAVAPSSLYMIGILLLTYWRLSRLIPAAHALIATLVLTTLPALATHATTPSADMAEAFWAVVAFWCIVAGTRALDGSSLFLASAGAAIALAFMGRETVLALILFIGTLFLCGYRIPRWKYWIAAIGFFVVAGAEALYYAAAAGDPFYRLSTLLGAVSEQGDRMQNVPPFTFDNTGVLRIWNPIDPLVMLLTKHSFGLFYYVLFPVTVLIILDWIRRRRLRETAPEWLDQAQLATLAGIIWIAFTAIVQGHLQILARYYITPTCFLFVATVLWISHMPLVRWRRTIFALIAIGVIVNLTAISLDNKNPRAGERAVAQFLKLTREPLQTDPLTAFRSQWFVYWAHQDLSRVKAGPPQPGGLYLFNPNTAPFPNRMVRPEETKSYLPDPGWPLVWKSEEPPPFIGRVLGSLGLSGIFPAAIRRKLIDPRPTISVYRVPSAQRQ